MSEAMSVITRCVVYLRIATIFAGRALALDDVRRLYRFLAPEDANAACRAVQAIRANVKVLAHQPFVGRPVDAMAPDFREWLINFGDNGYVALYRLNGETAAILAVRHQKEAGYSSRAAHFQ
jgi:plasmid stabilization system protein ParE